MLSWTSIKSFVKGVMLGKISDALDKSINEQKKEAEVTHRESVSKQHVSPQSDMRLDLNASRPRNDAGGFSDDPSEVGGVPKRTPTPVNQQIGEIDKNIISYYKPQTVEAEQFRILKTNIVFPEKGDPPKTIMVTSAMPGEGKSFVATNLAVSLAQNIDNHVLLVDCDMRRPTIHSLFGYKNSIPGLSTYLSGQAALPSLLVRTAIEKLTILPGGPPPPNPSELLSSERMASLLEELKTRYSDRFVVIDTPPPKLTAEASALAKLVDGIIVIVKYGATNRELVRNLTEMFERKKILGVVLNHFDTTAGGGYGYGKYGPYGTYGTYYGDRPVG